MSQFLVYERRRGAAVNYPQWNSGDTLDSGLAVLGVTTPLGMARAYPTTFLFSHAINDKIGDESVFIAYCPRCDTGLAFDPHVNGSCLTFGVYGKEFIEGPLGFRAAFEDLLTRSVWSLDGLAVEGPLAGSQLEPLITERTTWDEWRLQHPDTTALAPREKKKKKKSH